jgi:hypothetical protein
MLKWFTDVKTDQKVAINSEYVTAVFKATEGEMEGKTVISIINGQLAVAEDELDVVAQLNTAE